MLINKSVYLASPFFNAHERSVMENLLSLLRANYREVYAPYEHTIPNAWDMSNQAWGMNVFMEDIAAIDKADVVFVIDHGHYSDAGTAWECGYAYAKGKEVIHYAVDMNKTYSLMMVNGCTESNIEAVENNFKGEVK